MYLGIDAGTQSLKGVIIDSSRRVHFEQSVHYDTDLPEFGTRNGVCRADKTLCVRALDDKKVVTAPSAIFLAAIDLVLQKLKDAGADFSSIVSISGSGQQHGSVWWRHGTRSRLSHLTAARSLSDQLYDTFSLSHAPIWMDSSTSDECTNLEKEIGGSQALADISGSRAYERFTGNQIAKIAAFLPVVYANTERISLISSALASVFLGDYAAIDASDGAGMNLMDIRTMDWNAQLLKITVPPNNPSEKMPSPDEIDIHARALTLADRLGKIVPSYSIVGSIANYFVERYGFSSKCSIVAFSGDNPCSLIGLNLIEAGDAGISLGTSDTMMAVMNRDNAKPSGKEGHIFPHPTRGDLSMAMLCWKNGSVARQQCRDHTLAPHTTAPSVANSGGGSPNGVHRSHSSGARSPSLSPAPSSSISSAVLWSRFNECLTRSSSIAGNNGRLLYYYIEPEITPHTNNSGVIRFNAQNEQVGSFHDTLAPVPEFQHSRPSSPSLSPSRSPSVGSSSLSFHPSPWQTAEIRALIETQFLSMRYHAKNLGLENPKRIIATGGAASNTAILHILSDVFQCPVYVYKMARDANSSKDSKEAEEEGFAVNTAAIGAAFRALDAIERKSDAIDESKESGADGEKMEDDNRSAIKDADGTIHRSRSSTSPNPEAKRARKESLTPSSSWYALELLLVARPRVETGNVYEKMVSRYAECEAKVTEILNSPNYVQPMSLNQRRASSPAPFILNNIVNGAPPASPSPSINSTDASVAK